MCVVIAKKLKIGNTSEFALFKIRDRKYDVKYEIKSRFKNNSKLRYTLLIDEHSNWIEGINSNGIKLVSSALDNHSDSNTGIKNNNNNFSEYLKKVNKRNSEILKLVFRQETIEDSLKILSESRFIGNTLLSDGKKLYHIEIGIKQKLLLKYKETNFPEDISWSDFKVEIMKNLNEEDFTMTVKDISEKRFVVLTNHSTEKSGLGYTKDEEGYESSVKRNNCAKNIIKDKNSVEEIIYALYYQGRNCDNNPEFNPLRIKDKVFLSKKEKTKKDISPYYSTDIFGFFLNNIYMLPIYSKIKNSFMNNEFDTHLIILNKNSIYDIFEKYSQKTLNYILK